jgi:hypothetical protein
VEALTHQHDIIIFLSNKYYLIEQLKYQRDRSSGGATGMVAICTAAVEKARPDY